MSCGHIGAADRRGGSGPGRGPGSLAAGRNLAARAFVPRVVRVVAGRVVVAGIAESARRDPFLELLELQVQRVHVLLPMVEWLVSPLGGDKAPAGVAGAGIKGERLWAGTRSGLRMPN